MSTDAVVSLTTDRSIALQHSVEEFFYREADLLDERRYSEWMELLHPDVEYQVPLRRNVHSSDLDIENSRAGMDVLWFDEDLRTLRMRVTQIETGEHWAEEPVSRIAHLITNIRVVEVGDDHVDVTSRFHVERNRVDVETDTIVGRRLDRLVAADDGWRLRRRVALINQSVLQAKNVTFFF